MQKLLKAFELLKRPRLAKAAATHRVAAAVEHLPAIQLSRANTLIDAGANKGQFSLAFRSLRPSARIIAFEPLATAADIFEKLFANDTLTSLQRVALADADQFADFHITDRDDSSSLLKPCSGQRRAFGVREATVTTVPLRRLSDCVDFRSLSHPILLKVDVQGSELGVFGGCDQLAEIDFIYAELSFVELYKHQPLYDEVAAFLVDKGFRSAGVFNQVTTPAFGPTQADILFRRHQDGS